MSPLVLLAICILDGCLGDPRWFPHPVRSMGWVIGKIDQWVIRNTFSPGTIAIIGVCLAFVLPGVSYVLVTGIIYFSINLHNSFGLAVEIILGWTTLAMRDLFDHAQVVRMQLDSGNLEQAKQAVGRIVGRDTAHLSESEVVRGTVESLAESSVDGVVAPLFYLALGGVPLAMAFKAISTLDSIVGYRRNHYQYLGWASAKLDDLANWIPARVTAGLIIVAGGIHAGSIQAMKYTLMLLRRDAAKHPSPNSGWAEAAMAGVLGVQLGGTNVYHGTSETRATLGDNVKPLRPHTIGQARSILSLTFLFTMALALGWVWL